MYFIENISNKNVLLFKLFFKIYIIDFIMYTV